MKPLNTLVYLNTITRRLFLSHKQNTSSLYKNTRGTQRGTQYHYASMQMNAMPIDSMFRDEKNINRCSLMKLIIL